MTDTGCILSHDKSLVTMRELQSTLVLRFWSEDRIAQQQATQSRSWRSRIPFKLRTEHTASIARGRCVDWKLETVSGISEWYKAIVFDSQEGGTKNKVVSGT